MSEKQKNDCPLCHTALSRTPMGEKDGFDLVGCSACGSAMVDPLPTQQEQESFYGDLQPEIVHTQFHENYIKKVQRQLKKAGALEGKTFLDARARNGYAVVAAKNLNMKAKGLEPMEFYARFAQKTYGENLIEHAAITDYAASGQKADFIYAQQIFSEATDVDAIARALSQSLATGGILFIEELDGNHFNVPGHFPSCEFVDPPFNFIYPSKNGMAKLLDRHGLKIRKSFFCWDPLMRLIVVKK